MEQKLRLYDWRSVVYRSYSSSCSSSSIFRAWPLWALWALVVVVCAVAGLPLKQMFNRFKNIYSEVGSWLRGCGSRLQIVEAVAKLVLKCLQRSLQRWLYLGGGSDLLWCRGRRIWTEQDGWCAAVVIAGFLLSWDLYVCGSGWGWCQPTHSWSGTASGVGFGILYSTVAFIRLQSQIFQPSDCSFLYSCSGRPLGVQVLFLWLECKMFIQLLSS